MGYGHSEQGAALPVGVKTLIAGGFGVGKTTLVGSVSEVLPLTTEEYLTDEGIAVDDLAKADGKHATTVAMDFGRITINPEMVLYLFGVPGQDRFWFVWEELALGALGAVVLADTRRPADSLPAVDYFQRRGLPFIVAVNGFDDQPGRCAAADVRSALDLDPAIPVVRCDARRRDSVKQVLISLVEHVLRVRAT